MKNREKFLRDQKVLLVTFSYFKFIGQNILPHSLLMGTFLLWPLHCQGCRKCPQRTNVLLLLENNRACERDITPPYTNKVGYIITFDIYQWILFHHTACTRDTTTPPAFARDIIITSCIYKGYYHTITWTRDIITRSHEQGTLSHHHMNKGYYHTITWTRDIITPSYMYKRCYYTIGLF